MHCSRRWLPAPLLLLTACVALEQQIVWEEGTIAPGGSMAYSSLSEQGRWSARIEADRTVIEIGAVHVELEGFGSRQGLDYHLRKDGSANLTLVLPGDRRVVWEADQINVAGQVHALTQPGRYVFDRLGELLFEPSAPDEP